MMYELETDAPLARVELNYVTSDHTTFHSAYVAPSELTTTYDDRQEEFGSFMDLLGKTVADSYCANVEVDPYAGEKSSRIGRTLATFSETDGIRVAITGNKDAIEAFIEGVADLGYGLSQDHSFLADWHHPVQSVRGYLAARSAEKDTDLVEVRREEDGVRHITFNEE